MIDCCKYWMKSFKFVKVRTQKFGLINNFLKQMNKQEKY